MNCIKYFFAIFPLALIGGCVPDPVNEPIINNSYEYFPLEVGKQITYAVDSIVFDDIAGGNKKDTVSFEIREEITDVQISGNDSIYYIHRSRRDVGSSSWKLTDVWTARIEENEALRTEENLTFRKMVFPLTATKEWIATAYIHPLTEILIGTENVQAYQSWEAEVIHVDIAEQIGSFSFAPGNVMHIQQSDTDDGATKRFVLEKYVRGIGLVQRIDTILDSRCLEPPGDFTPCIGKSWDEHAGKGYILSQLMTAHN